MGTCLEPPLSSSLDAMSLGSGRRCGALEMGTSPTGHSALEGRTLGQLSDPTLGSRGRRGFAQVPLHARAHGGEVS